MTRIATIDKSSRLRDEMDVTGDGLLVDQATLLAGERNTNSSSNSYLVVKPESNATRADIGTTETLITDAPAHLLGVVPNDANTGYLDIIDASATGSGNTPVFRVNLGDGGAAGVAVLTGIAARFENGICVDGENAACDVTILWRPQ